MFPLSDVESGGVFPADEEEVALQKSRRLPQAGQGGGGGRQRQPGGELRRVALSQVLPAAHAPINGEARRGGHDIVNLVLYRFR